MDSKRLQNVSLFVGMEQEEIEAILSCLTPRARSYHKSETIIRLGDTLTEIGVVLSGCVDLEKVDYWGGRVLLSRINSYEVLGETYACLGGTPCGVHAVAAQNSEVLWLEVQRLLTQCSHACVFHSRLIQNLLITMAQKNLQLSQKLSIVTQRSTRAKLSEYLSLQAQTNHSAHFTIPFNRQQLADYLSIDRSAMTVELGKMAADGLIRFDKNHFELL